MSKLLGTLAPRLDLSSPADFWGKNFASVYFALTIASAFDGCHFVVPTVTERQAALEALSRWGLSDGVDAMVALELPERLASGDYAAFHVPDVFPDMAAICHLRRKSGADFRVTAIIHSISYASLERDILDLLLAPTSDSDLVFCSSRAGLSALLNLFAHVRERKGLSGPIPLSLAVVPFGVDTLRFAPGDRLAALAAIGLPCDRRYFLSVARLSIHDKFDVGPLLEAFGRAAAQVGERWDLVLAGGARDPAYREFVAQQVADKGLEGRVHFLSNFDDALKPQLYAACDVFVSPSDNLQETFGLAVIEAMACGLPVIGSDWDGYKDTIDHGVVGYRVPSYMPLLPGLLADRQVLDNSLVHLLVGQGVAVDVRAFARRMIELASDPDLRRQMGAAARERAEARYCYEVVARQLRDLLDAPSDPEDPPLDRILPQPVGGAWSPFTLFSHYPTRSLSGVDRLVATPLGCEALEREIKVYLCDEMQLLLRMDLTKPLIRACREPRPLDDLLSSFGPSGEGAPDRHRERLLYTIHWMVKQGLLDVLDEAD